MTPTLSVMTKEMANALAERIAGRQLSNNSPRSQLHVDFVPDFEGQLSLEAFCELHLRPLAEKLASAIGVRQMCILSDAHLPAGVSCSIAATGAASVRGVEQFLVEMGKTAVRFDVFLA